MSAVAEPRRGTGVGSISITRRINASPEAVFTAWTSVDALKQWWGPRGFTTPTVEVEVRVGGAYRIGIRSHAGQEGWMCGEYREVSPSSRLVLTHQWIEEDFSKRSSERVITVDFASTGKGKTRVTFEIEGFDSDIERDSEIEGWSEFMQKLVDHFDHAERVKADVAELRRLAEEWSQAFQRKDAAALASFVADDIVLYDAIPPVHIKGKAAYEQTWAHCLPCFPKQFTCVRKDERYAVDGDVAHASFLHKIVLPEGQTSPAADSWLRITICYRRENGQWKSMHEHVSIPFNPMTGQVAFITDDQVNG
ncbi:MAG: SRPBCC domain-containing protein [Tepidisphaeraceae bacterium]